MVLYGTQVQYGYGKVFSANSSIARTGNKNRGLVEDHKDAYTMR